jgi:hypothetical protein
MYFPKQLQLQKTFFWCVKEGVLFNVHYSAQYLSVLGSYTLLIGKCLVCSNHLCYKNPKSNGLKVVNSVNLSFIGIMQGIWISTMLVECSEQLNKYNGHMSRTEWYTPYSLLTPWSRVLPEKLTSLQLVKKFPAFYGTQRFVTTFVSARHLFLSWAGSMQNDILTTIKVWSARIYPFHIFFTLLQFPSTTLPLIPSSSLCILFAQMLVVNIFASDVRFIQVDVARRVRDKYSGRRRIGNLKCHHPLHPCELLLQRQFTKFRCV